MQVKLAAVSELSALGTAMNAMSHNNKIAAVKVYSPKMKFSQAQLYRKDWENWLNILSTNQSAL